MFINLDTASLLRGAMGGVLIGASSAILLRLTGRTLGVSSILSSASSGRAGLGSWQLSFLAGLSASGAALSLSFPVVFGSATAVAPGATAAAALVAGGALVGWGTAEGCGCTSGHGVSGLGRLSPRSATAVGTFMAVGAAVAYASAQLALTGGGAAAAQRSAMGAVLTAAAPLVATVALGAAWASRRRVAAAAPTAADVTPLSQHVAAALCGAMFGAGLGLSGMADPAKVRGFLNPASATGWDPTLACVMGGAVAVTLCAYYATASVDAPPPCAPAGAQPLSASINYGPNCKANQVIDVALVRGAAVFGVGWAITGGCPGPVLLSAAAGVAPAQLVLAGIVAGALAHEL